jgi:ribonucleoside-diphosphate reductase alpha chain
LSMADAEEKTERKQPDRDEKSELQENHLTHIVKRSGKLVLFDEKKVVSAVWKAMQATEEGTKEDAESVKDLIVKKLNDAFPENPPTVEDVQDIVEQALMELQFVKVAKGYILYRHERSQLREEKSQLMGGKIDELDLAINGLRVLEQRYLMRDEKGNIIETPSELFWRVANKIASAEHKFGEDQRQAARTFFKLMTNMEFLPSSPILMNAGTPRQLSSCCVLPIDDHIDSIFKTLADAAIMQKNGSGTGFSFSRLRPKGDFVAGNSSTTSGPLAFMRIYEMAMHAVKQGGRRQGANMAILRVDHPDILDFINLKLDGQTLSNFNISVAVTDQFMEAVEQDAEYDLINPRTKQAVGKLNARVVFDSILASSWRVGDPGILFIDRINTSNSCKHIGEYEATSPCAEQPMLPYECCVEGSINLAVCVKKRRGKSYDFDWEKLRRIVHDAVWFLDDAVDVNNYLLPDVERMTKGTRRIGLGVMGFADLLFELMIPYDTDEGVELGERIAKAIAEDADRASHELALKRGTYGFYKGSAHEKAGNKRRNAVLLGIAPTGTISLIADVSGGLEPNFALTYRRTLADGRELTVVNPFFEGAAQELDDDVIRKIVQRGVIDAEDAVPEEIRRVFVTSQHISPESHIKMQAAFQKWIDGAISKTINFPANVGIREIGEGLFLAWKMGCKGITVYRDGSLTSQVLTVGRR